MQPHHLPIYPTASSSSTIMIPRLYNQPYWQPATPTPQQRQLNHALATDFYLFANGFRWTPNLPWWHYFAFIGLPSANTFEGWHSWILNAQAWDACLGLCRHHLQMPFATFEDMVAFSQFLLANDPPQGFAEDPTGKNAHTMDKLRMRDYSNLAWDDVMSIGADPAPVVLPQDAPAIADLPSNPVTTPGIRARKRSRAESEPPADDPDQTVRRAKRQRAKGYPATYQKTMQQQQPNFIDLTSEDDDTPPQAGPSRLPLVDRQMHAPLPALPAHISSQRWSRRPATPSGLRSSIHVSHNPVSAGGIHGMPLDSPQGSTFTVPNISRSASAHNFYHDHNFNNYQVHTPPPRPLSVQVPQPNTVQLQFIMDPRSSASSTHSQP